MNKYILTACIVLLSVLSCKKDSNNGSNSTDFFPPVAVRIDINLALPQYNVLTLPQGWVYEAGGNKGVVIYHTINDEYVAFDRTCPVDPQKECAFVSVDSSNSFYRCSQFPNSGKTCTGVGFCSSRFDAANGFPVTGSAQQALRLYFVKKDGTFLHIQNTPF
jgi:hypothetical protein